MRWIEPGSSTVLHQFAVTPNGARYDRTGVVSGNLVTDYAIDERSNGDIRLVTQKTGTIRETLVNVLDHTFNKLGELGGLGKDENFQSARFIGDTLYLVTFRQIDPFFVIDLSDSAKPTLKGELKIPGYSTYLHPYDATHLIGIGYDTVTNQWGGTQNSGFKIDLYDVADIANPKQAASLTLGGVGSYSEVLNNPRLFVWQKSKNRLYLPATLYTSASVAEPYRYVDVFQGVVALSIDPTGGVKEVARSTQIAFDNIALEKERTAECLKYQASGIRVCRPIIGGGEYCDSGSSYVPTYCYADSPIGEYRVTKFWNQSDRFIDRVLYAGSRLFTFSPNMIESLDIENILGKKGSVKLK